MRRLPILMVTGLAAVLAFGVLSQRASVMNAEDMTLTPTTQAAMATVVASTPAPVVPQSDGVNLTIYNQGTALIQDRRTFKLKSGVGMLDFTDVAASIDSTSVSFKSLTDPAGTSVLEQIMFMIWWAAVLCWSAILTSRLILSPTTARNLADSY